MAHSITDNGKMELQKEKVNFNIQTETFIKDNSNQIDKMDLVSIYILMDKLI